MSQISKKRKFVADGLFYAELNELLTRELAEDGYSGVEVRVTPMRTEVIIRATRTQEVLGEKGRRIRELTAVVRRPGRWGPPRRAPAPAAISASRQNGPVPISSTTLSLVPSSRLRIAAPKNGVRVLSSAIAM